MPVTRTAAILAILFFSPWAAWCIQDVRGIGRFILPWLAGAMSVALILVAFGAWLLFRLPTVQDWLRSFWGVYLATCLCVASYFLVVGPMIPLVEKLAEIRAEQIGHRLGDSGTCREFYTEDSGMGHWPSKGSTIPMIGLALSPAWMILLAAWLGAARLIDFVLRRGDSYGPW